tara:strand:- start:4441 stop:6123 length:1683 start_codon:yes stop_codon:yes gene_type:complete
MARKKKKKLNPNAPVNPATYDSKSKHRLKGRTKKKVEEADEDGEYKSKASTGKIQIFQGQDPENKALELKSLPIQSSTTFNRDVNNTMQQRMAGSSAYRDALGNNYTSKSAYEAGQRAALNTVTQSGRDELNTPTQLLNAPTTRAQANFSGGDQLIGSITGDWTSATPTLAEVASGAQRANTSSGSFTTTGNPFNPRSGQRASTVIDTRTGGAVNTNVSNKELRSQMGSMNNVTQMGKVDSQGRGRVFDFVSGATGFEDSDAMTAAAQNSKYSPVKVGSHSTRDYDLSSNDGGRMLTGVAGSTLQNSVFRGIGQSNQPNITGVTKVAPEFEYNPVSGKDSYSKLQVERTTSPIKISKGDTGFKGGINSLKKGGRGKTKRNKVEKLKGAVDLDMDGVIGNTRLERNAKSFAGNNKLYSTRRAAKNEIKRGENKKVGRTPEKQSLKMKQDEQKVLHKKDFNYLVDGEKKTADRFRKSQEFNVRKFNKNQADFNTQHMNQGIGQNTLTGADGYTARFNVNKNEAFGTGAPIGKHNELANTNQKKYQKLQKRLNSKVLGKFYKK